MCIDSTNILLKLCDVKLGGLCYYLDRLDFLPSRGDSAMNKQFFIVDVFAEGRYSGNPLAVFIDAEGIPDEEMQLIAREINFSETTFVLSRELRNGGYDVRIFTPETEVPFAGHPTLGTAYIIKRELIKENVKELNLNLKVGQIPVFFTEEAHELLWMRQKPPSFGKHVSHSLMAEVLGVEVADLDNDYPVEEVSTGLPCLIVPLRSLDALKRIKVNLDRYYSLIEDLDAKLILAFCPETRRGDTALSVRVFAHYYGVPEDPATGSANGCLAAYLCRHRYFGDEINIKVEQGYEIKRPSLIFLRARGGDKMEIWIGGKVILIAKGIFV